MSAAELVETLVKEHNTLYVQLFKDTLKPKMHFLVHDGRALADSGPIPYLSTIRYEAKHEVVKDSANSTTSRRNVTCTLALKMQLNLCERFLANKGFEDRLETGPVDIVSDWTEFENVENFDQVVRSAFSRSLSTPWVDYKGTVYRIGSCVALGVDDDTVPYFGIISTILENDKESVSLVCRVWSCDGFDSHMHAYPVKKKQVPTSVYS